MTAFRASYADWKLIKTRACVQIVFELPVEQADAAYQLLGGMPVAAREVWCGIARLETEKPRPSNVPASADGAEKERRKFDTLPYAQQAALRCNDPIYRAFLREMCGHRPANNLDDIEQAADFIRERCGVESRRDIRPDTGAETMWLDLEQWFSAWQTKERVMA